MGAVGFKVRRRLALLALGLTAMLQGCAVPPPAAGPIIPLEGTSWRVVSVNGRATPAQGDYSMRLDAGGRFGARFGCNHMGGDYAVRGDVLTVRNLASTLMGCPEPAGTLEREGAAVLAQPVRIAFASNERIFLSNGGGTIALDPQ